MNRRIIAAVFLATTAGTAVGYDHEAGQEAYLFTEDAEQACTACHDDSYFLDNSNRTAESFFELKGWIKGCVQEFPQGWFPEDEDNVAAYLNREYYGFPEN